MVKFPSGCTTPIAQKKQNETHIHGDVLVDEYFWLREKDNPAVLEHLNTENAYCACMLKPADEGRERLFQEMKARIKEDDSEVPSAERASIFTIPGSRSRAADRPIHCRKSSKPNGH